MKIPTIKVIFDRKNKSGANIPGIVEIRVAMNNRIYYISTRIKCLRRDFSDGTEPVSIMRRKIDEYINGCISDNKSMSINDMRSYILRDEETESFIDFVSDRAESRPVRASTHKRYDVLISVSSTKYNRLKVW